MHCTVWTAGGQSIDFYKSIKTFQPHSWVDRLVQVDHEVPASLVGVPTSVGLQPHSSVFLRRSNRSRKLSVNIRDLVNRRRHFHDPVG